MWCPKYRSPVLGGRVKTRLEELIRARAGERGRRIVALEVMADHVHLFVKPHPKISPSHVANRFEGFTSHHLRAEFAHPRSRLSALWSRSCFVAAPGAGSAETAQRHMETQDQRPAKGTGRA